MSLDRGPAEAKPRLLDGVVCLVKPSEHPVGHRLQVGPVGLELFRQPFVFVHLVIPSVRSRRRSQRVPALTSETHVLILRSHMCVSFRHRSDEPFQTNVTGKSMRKSKQVNMRRFL